MNTKRRRFGQIALVTAILVGAVISVAAGRDWYRRAHPRATFASITGRQLPLGVEVTAYAHAVTDNLFHTTHYWLLAGSASGLREVMIGGGFEPTEDGELPDLHALFGSGQATAEIVASYESNSARNHWYFIFAGETTALYAY
jgi:hypothetical protein